MSKFGEHTLSTSVPDDWKVVPLGDALEKVVGGGTPARANPSYWSGNIPWLTVKDMRTRRPADSMDHISNDAVENSSTNIIPADTVIIATRIGLGKVIRVPFPAAINQDLKALVPKEGIDKNYLEYWICSIASYLESIGSGTTVKGIRLEQLKNLPFPIAPLGQQHRIVAEIEKQFSRLDEAVASLKRVKANLRRYKAAVLKAAVEGKLTEEWRKQNPDVEPASELLERILAERRTKWEEAELAKMRAKGKEPKNDKWKEKYVSPPAIDSSGMPNIPDCWCWSEMNLWADVVDPQPSHRTPPAVERGVPYIGIGDVKSDGSIDFEGARQVGAFVLEEHKSRYKLKDGDFIFGKIGTIGRPVVLPRPYEYTLSANVVLIQPLEGRLHPGFAFYLLCSPFFQLLAKQQSRATTQAAFGIRKIRAAVCPIPSYAEQEEIGECIARYFSIIESLEKNVGSLEKKVGRSRQSVLAAAFAGVVGSEIEDGP